MRSLIWAAVGMGLLATSGEAQWVEAPGQGWVDVAVYHFDTRDAYQFDRVSRPLFNEGHAVSTSVFVTAALGIVRGVDAWVQAPYQRLRFDDARDQRIRSGIGDTRLYVRTQPLTYLGSSFPFAIRAGGKFAVGDFEVDSEVIPLGDGQTDWEVMAEVGHSFWPVDAYVNGWAGYRFRTRNEDADRDFGDEFFFLAQAGGNRGPLGIQVIFEGMESVTVPIIEGVALPNAERAVYQITPKISYALGPGAANVGMRFATAGQNLPSGVAIVFGYFARWGL